MKANYNTVRAEINKLDRDGVAVSAACRDEYVDLEHEVSVSIIGDSICSSTGEEGCVGDNALFDQVVDDIIDTMTRLGYKLRSIDHSSSVLDFD